MFKFLPLPPTLKNKRAIQANEGFQVRSSKGFTCRRLGPSLGQEDALEKEMATPSSTLTWEIQWTE